MSSRKRSSFMKYFKKRVKWSGTIERLIWGGIGLCSDDDGRKVLLSSTLALFPGEKVEAMISSKSRHKEGQVISWITSNSMRVKSQCLFAGTCGGCDLLEAGVSGGILKKQMVEDLLSRSLPKVQSWRWLEAPNNARRHRIQLHWDGYELGFYRRNSHTVVPVNKCIAAVDELSQAISKLRDAIKARKLSAKIQRWELTTGTPSGIVYAVGSLNKEDIWRLGIDDWHIDRGPVSHLFGNVEICHEVGGFFQVCPSWAWDAFEQIFINWELPKEILFDLYSGVGFFSALFGDRFDKRFLIEENESASIWGHHNMDKLGFDAICLTADVNKWLKPNIGSPGDLILLDPPRSGLTENICLKLQNVGVEYMILIGCDGAVFCRDICRLEPAWEVRDLVAIDLFPMTKHVEFVALLYKKNTFI